MRRAIHPILLVLVALCVVGCSRGPLGNGIVSEQEEAAFRRGKQRLKEGRPDEALDAFMAVIDHRQEAPESHLEAGLLYLNRFNEPVLAIYHFNTYLRANPNSEQAERVRQLIITAKKEFARSLPAAPFGDEVDKLDLKELLEKTRAENNDLKNELMKAREEIEHLHTIEDARRGVLATAEGIPTGSGSVATTNTKPASVKPAAKESAPTTATPKTYTVTDGDTLSVIAKKIWGASSRWKEIYEANRDTMKTPHSLKIGQQLIIP